MPKISELSTATGSAMQGASDWIPIVDTSADDTLKISPQQLNNVPDGLLDTADHFNTATVEAALAQVAAKGGDTLFTSDIVGMDDTGATNMGTLINAAIVQTAAAGVRLHVNSAIVMSTERIKCVSGTRMSMEPGCYFLRNFTSTGQSGFIGAGTAVETSDDVWLWGIKVVSPDYTTYTGNVFCAHGDRWEIYYPIVETYGSGRAVSWLGDDGVLVGAKVTDPRDATGTGGIRYLGGNNFKCSDCHVLSGDDAFQVVPAASGGEDAINVMYSNCSGGSSQGKLITVGLTDQDATGGMTASIKSVSFVGVRGYAQKAINVINEDSSGIIDNVLIQDVACDCSDSDNAQAILVQANTPGANTYEVRNVTLRNITIRSPYRTVMQIKGGAVNGFVLDGYEFEQARQSGYAVAKVLGVQRGYVRNGLMSTNGDMGWVIGPATGDPENRTYDFHILENNKVQEVADGMSAVKLLQATYCSVDGIIPVRKTAATTSVAITLTTDANYNLIGLKNDYTSIDTFIVDASTGLRRVQVSEVFGYKSGNYYSCWDGASASATAVPAVDTIYLMPFIVQEAVKVSTLACRIVTGGAGSAMKMAIYANKAGAPVGSPLIYSNTGVATTSNNTTVTVSASGTLYPGTYWAACKFTGTLPTAVSISNASMNSTVKMGRSSIVNNNTVVALTYAHAYATNFPDLTGVSTSNESGNGVPVMYFGVT